MFFRRMFSRKSNGSSAPSTNNNNRHSARLPHSPKKLQRNSSSEDKRGLSVLQLTPLWEHIIRTRTLPEDLNPAEMFEEFLERLRDPEWQVRQHALRVLVDVLLVIGQKADSYFSPIIPQLVENLGHPAPTVRKGALDCLRVYISNTAMPETILLEILDIGLNQRITNEPFGGRLTCGVMLSLPSLIQAILHTSKRNYILRTTIDMLVSKMTQITHQEITLKVLLRIKELIGPREFSEYMSHGSYREFDLLCNVYGLDNKKTLDTNRAAWTLLSSFESEDSDAIWHLSDEGQVLESSDNGNDDDDDFKDKVIMETQIKIKDDTLTMRIVETEDTPTTEDVITTVDDACSRDEDADDPDDSVNDVLENSGIIQVLSDSEVDESNGNIDDINDVIRRTPKRVTFGGEVVKIRTPDSDTVTHSDIDDVSNKSASNFSTLNFLTVEIPNDNTKPVIQSPKVNQNHQQYLTKNSSTKSSPVTTSSEDMSPQQIPTRKSSAEQMRIKSSSPPKSPFRRISVSPVDDIISPKPPHKEIEVLHNLQRSPCPSPGIRAKRQNSKTDSSDNDDKKITEKPGNMENTQAKSWEDLGLVDQSVINNLKSGDWRHRSNAIYSIEEVLRSSENLALVIPHLDSLFRALLSSERNAEVIEDKRNVIINLISRIPLDNVENRTNQIITGLCRQGGAGSNLVCKILMQRIHPAAVVLKLLSDEFLHARSSKFRENALQMVMFALMTFPSTCFDTATCVTRATFATLNRKKRVRQASLDVLAILGQITSPRSVMDIVQNIGNTRNDGNDLCAAVKARLARKQLPIISSNGFVQYALRVPSPQLNDPQAIKELGADIEWITAGVGSVSPTSMKRRLQRYSPNDGSINGKSFSDKNRNMESRLRSMKAPHEILGMGVGVKAFEDSGNSDEKGNLQNSLATGGVPMQMRAINTGDIIGIHGKRIATKSCSDSSQDGRSSDSTGDSSIRQLRSSVTSRFPAMERLDVTGIYVDRQSYRNPYSDFGSQRLNSTYPKSNYSIHQKRVPKNYYNHQETFTTESSFDDSSFGINSSQNSKRFTNVEKLIMQSNKPPQQQQQQQQQIYHSTSDCIHHHEQLNGRSRQSEDIKKIETLSKTAPAEQHETPTNDNQMRLQNSLNSLHKDKDPLLNGGGGGDGDGDGGYIIESSELSSEDRLSSGHSTPTRVLGEMVTPTSVKSDLGRISRTFSSKSVQNISVPPSRSQSFSNVDYESEIISTPPAVNKNQLESNEDNLSNNNKEEGNNNKCKEEEEIYIVEEIPENITNDSNKLIDMPEISKSAEKDIIQDQSKIEEMITKATDYNEENTVTIAEKSIEETVAAVVEQNETTLLEVQSSANDIVDFISSSKEDDSVTQKNAESKEKDEEQEDDEELQTVYESKDIIKSFQPISSSTSPIPTMEVKPIAREFSIAKSSDLIFEPSSLKPELDTKSITSTEASSDYQPSHTTSLDDGLPNDFMLNKPRHIPLMRKSKTTLFGRNRRVSPVKQSIKLSKAEVFPQTLTKYDRPKEAFNQSIAQLDSPDWETVIQGLRSFVRLMRYHPELLDLHMHMVCIQLAKTARNLRSQVARAACQASTELFTIRSKHLEQECDDLVGSLLHRTADTNRFLRADATRALESMCDNLMPSKILHILTNRGAVHQNAMVRTSTAKLLNRLADRIGCDRIYNMNRENRDKFIITGANLLLEGSLETRSYAKALFRLLSNHHSYSRLLLEVIPSKTYRNIEKTLKSIQ